MKKINSVWRMIVLNTYRIGLSFKWNTLNPIILPAGLSHDEKDRVARDLVVQAIVDVLPENLCGRIKTDLPCDKLFIFQPLDVRILCGRY